MKILIVLSVLFVLSSASFGGKRRRDRESDDRSVYPKLGTDSDKSGLVRKGETALFPFSELPDELQKFIINFLGNDFIKIAQVSRFCYGITRNRHREYLVSRLSAYGGITHVLTQFEKSFKDQKHSQVRDHILGCLVTLVRWCRQNFPGKDLDGLNPRRPVDLFLRFERPTAEVYDLLFRRGAYKDKLIPEDFLHLQRLFAGDAGLLSALICSSDEHLDDLRALLSIEMDIITRSKCVVMAYVLIGTGNAPVYHGPSKILAESLLRRTGKVPIPTSPLKVLADSIHPNLMEITFGLNRNAPYAMIVEVYNRLKREGGLCATLADKLSALIGFSGNRVDLRNANQMFRELGLPNIDDVPKIYLLAKDLFDHEFNDRHRFTFEQCSQMLSRFSLGYCLYRALNKDFEVTPRTRKLIQSTFSAGLERESADLQLQFHVIILQDVSTFSKWDQVSPSLIAEIAMESNSLSTFLTADMKICILSNAAPILLNSTSRDDLMVRTYFYFNGNDRWAFISIMSPTQIRTVLDIALRHNLEYDVMMLFERAGSTVKQPLFNYVNEHPDYVPHASILPVLFLHSTNDAFRDLNRGNITVDELAACLVKYQNIFEKAEFRASRVRFNAFKRSRRSRRRDDAPQ